MCLRLRRQRWQARRAKGWTPPHSPSLLPALSRSGRERLMSCLPRPRTGWCRSSSRSGTTRPSLPLFSGAGRLSLVPSLAQEREEEEEEEEEAMSTCTTSWYCLRCTGICLLRRFRIQSSALLDSGYMLALALCQRALYPAVTWSAEEYKQFGVSVFFAMLGSSWIRIASITDLIWTNSPGFFCGKVHFGPSGRFPTPVRWLHVG